MTITQKQLQRIINPVIDSYIARHSLATDPSESFEPLDESDADAVNINNDHNDNK